MKIRRAIPKDFECHCGTCHKIIDVRKAWELRTKFVSSHCSEACAKRALSKSGYGKAAIVAPSSR